MKFYYDKESGGWYKHIVHFDSGFKSVMLECLQRGLNTWTETDKADAIRRLIEDMEKK